MQMFPKTILIQISVFAKTDQTDLFWVRHRET